jgi:hypothetical protein
MEQKKEKTQSIVYSSNESAETLFERIKDWDIHTQVKFAVSVDNQQRKDLFKKMIECVTDDALRQNLLLIAQRIEQAGFDVSGYSASEIEHYQSLFAEHFFTVLHSKNYQTYIEDKIRELHFYCDGLTQDLKTKQYEFLEDRQQDKNQLTEAERYKHFLESLLVCSSKPIPKQNETKTDKLKAELGKYGFFELPTVKQLSEPNKQTIVELISENPMPYGIAMFDYLGFLKHLKTEHFKTDNRLFKEVANWFEVSERMVKGNIYVLNEFSKENRVRYTADQQKETVQIDYQNLK